MSFFITNDKDLSYVLRKMKELQTEKDRIEQLAEHEIQRIKEWKQKEQQELTDNISSYTNMVEQYAAEQRINDPKFKKLSTPYGTVKFKKQQPEWVYDEKEILRALRENDLVGFIRMKEEVNKEEIKKSVTINAGEVYDTETGIKIEGIKVNERDDKIIVEVT